MAAQGFTIAPAGVDPGIIGCIHDEYKTAVKSFPDLADLFGIHDSAAVDPDKIIRELLLQ